MIRTFRGVVALLMTLAAPVAAFAQASIAGLVKDSSGAVLPGVSVEATSPALIEKVRSVVTDGAGQFKIVDLRPGTYTVTFTLSGFNTIRRDGIELAGSFAANLNVEMRVGALEETVTVTGESPTVDVQTVTQQRVISKEVIDAIPTARTHFTLAVLVPGVTTNTQDTGGTVGPGGSGTQSITVHGSRAGDGRVQVDGFSTHSQECSGNCSAYIPNMSASQEVTVDTSGASAEQSQGGVRINVIPKEGGNRFGGTLFLTGTNGSFQGNNLDEDLISRGLSTPSDIRKIYDFAPGFGGPLRRDRLWFYVSGRQNVADNYVGGMYINKNAGNINAWTYDPDPSRPANNLAYSKSVNGRLTWQATPKDKIGFFFDSQNRCNSCPGATTTFAPEALINWSRWPLQRLVSLTWSQPTTNRLLLEGGYAHHAEGWHNVSGADRSLISVTEQSTGIQYRGARANGGLFNTTFPSYTAVIHNMRAAASYVTGSHAFKAGFVTMWGYRNQDIQDNTSSTSYRFNNGIPNQITERATPFMAYNNLKADLGIYAQDRWTLSRTTMTLGVRFDYFNDYFPAQQVGPATLVPNRNLSFPRTPHVNWKDLSPRLGLSHDLFGNGSTALKVTVNRYVAGQTLNGDFGSAANPVARLANAVTRSWNDADRDFVPDCDLLSPVANGECGAMSNAAFGNATSSTQYDPDVISGWGVRNYNWEFSTSVQRELASRVSLSAGFFRRWYGNFAVTDNLAVSAADYNGFSIAAPSDARLPGGGGYTINSLYDLNPSKVGQVSNYLTLSDKIGKQTDHWNGVDVSVNARLAAGLTAQGGISTGRQTTDNCEILAKVPEVSPLGVPYCSQSTGFTTQVKAFAAYTLPFGGVQTSATFQSIPGPTIAANYVALNAQIAPSLGRNLSGGANNATVNLIAPGSMYGERLNQLDLRVGKNMRFGGLRAALNVDLYNVFNTNTVLTENSAYANWRRPQSTLTARFLKFSAQLDF